MLALAKWETWSERDVGEIEKHGISNGCVKLFAFL